jgi:glyoxylase-like metal-dependent hydrolase (beta-lactamase superfamily II)
MSAVRVDRQDHTQVIQRECDVVTHTLGDTAKRPEVTSFFDAPTNTASHVVWGQASRRCGVIDSVLDYAAASGRTATESVDELIAFIRDQGLEVEWILETHVHADHLLVAPYIKERIGGALGIGENVRVVQDVFGKVFNAGPNSSATAASSTICSSMASTSRSANSTWSPCTHQATRRMG